MIWPEENGGGKKTVEISGDKICREMGKREAKQTKHKELVHRRGPKEIETHVGRRMGPSGADRESGHDTTSENTTVADR